MSARRLRTIELLAQAGLTKDELAREEAKAQRDAENTGQWIGALSSLIPAGVGVADKVYGAAESNAIDKAKAFAAEHGDVADPSAVSALVASNPDLQAPEKSGNFFDDFAADPFGAQSAIRQKAKTEATTALATTAKANRTAATKAELDEKRIDASIDKAITAREARDRELADRKEERQLVRDIASGTRTEDQKRRDAEIAARNEREDQERRERFAREDRERAERIAREDRLRAEDKEEKKATRTTSASTDLRKEFSARPEVKAYNDVLISYDKMKAAATKPSAAGDLSLIFSFMKMLDPGSTVREGEFANAQNAGGINDSVVNAYNKALNGERLNESQRRDFLAQAGSFLAAQKTAYDAAVSTYIGLAEKNGIDPADVVGGAAPKKKPPAASSVPVSGADFVRGRP